MDSSQAVLIACGVVCVYPMLGVCAGYVLRMMRDGSIRLPWKLVKNTDAKRVVKESQVALRRPGEEM